MEPEPAPAEPTPAIAGVDPASPDAALPLKPKTRRPSAETAFRVLVGEHIRLTALADNKAHMLIQMNGLKMSVMLASSSFILRSPPWVRFPCTSLAITALVSILFAVLAARPKLAKPKTVSFEDLRSGKASLLFFGNFGRIREDQFAEAMREMYADDERVYENLSRHVHGIGSILLGKFRLLRIAYTVFLGGILLAGAMFVLGLVVARMG